MPLVVDVRMLGEERQDDNGTTFVSHGICFATLTSVAFAAEAIVSLDGRVIGACDLGSGASTAPRATTDVF